MGDGAWKRINLMIILLNVSSAPHQGDHLTKTTSRRRQTPPTAVQPPTRSRVNRPPLLKAASRLKRNIWISILKFFKESGKVKFGLIHIKNIFLYSFEFFSE